MSHSASWCVYNGANVQCYVYPYTYFLVFPNEDVTVLSDADKIGNASPIAQATPSSPIILSDSDDQHEEP